MIVIFQVIEEVNLTFNINRRFRTYKR